MDVLGFFRGKRESAKPKTMQGAQGFVVTGGYIQSNEINTKLHGQTRWKVAGDLLTNISIIAAGVRYSLNLIARPAWSFEPANDSAEAEELAEFAQSVLDDIEGTWTAVVRRIALYRWHGFGLHEWQAMERPEDGRIGIAKVAVRPCHTVERWDIEADGTIKGVWQKRPIDGKEIYLPRAKTLYLVDDSLTDNPEGMGWFRHLVEPASRLKRLLEIETMGFERDLNGIPVGRAPISEINAMVGTIPQGWSKTFTKEDADAAIDGITSFVRMEAKKPGTGVLLDSQPFASVSADGESLTGEKMWDIDLLTSDPNGLDAIAKAVERLEYEMALVMGTDSMLTGRGGEGSRALSEDKSHNLYLLAESTIGDIKEVVDRDLIGPLWAMNGLPDELKPKAKTESINFKDAAHIAQVLKDMATAGAVLAPDDPAIDDLRSLLDLPPQPTLTDEERGILMGTKPSADAQLTAEQKEKEKEEEPPGGPPNPSGGRGQAQKEFDPNQPRDRIGRWTDGNSESAGYKLAEIAAQWKQLRDATGAQHVGKTEEWLLAEGEEFGPRVALPAGVGMGPQKMCYQNSFRALAYGKLDTDEWFYTEGVTFMPGFPLPIDHAWLSNKDGEVLELTLRDPSGHSYYGIPYKWDYVQRQTMENGYYGLHSNGVTVDPNLVGKPTGEKRAWAKVEKFNPHHRPAGDPRGGEFTSAGLSETSGKPPEVGKPFLVYRAGKPGNTKLENRNAGNSVAVGTHLARLDDFESPKYSGQADDARDLAIHAYKVTLTEPVGPYAYFNAGVGAEFGTVGYSNNGGDADNFSFGTKGYTYEYLGSVPASEVMAALQTRVLPEYTSFDEFGGRETGRTIRELFKPVARPEPEYHGNEIGEFFADGAFKYNPDQPRDPAGTSTGGRWTSGGGSMPEYLYVDGRMLATTNSLGNPIAKDEAGVRKFWEWFGNSYYKDDLGRPEVWFHGTLGRDEIEVFDRHGAHYPSEESINAIGTWITDRPEIADLYAGASDTEREPPMRGMTVYPLYVRSTFPLVSDDKDLDRLWQAHAGGDRATYRNGSATKFRAWLKSQNYDSMVFRANDLDRGFDKAGGGRYAVILESNQMKSAVASGFDPNDPRIHKQYNPNQPRHPAGTESGGEWSGGSGGGSAPKIKAPKSFAELKADPRVEMIDDYRPDGLMVSLKPGWIWDGQRSFGVETVAEALRMMRGVRPMTQEELDYEASEKRYNPNQPRDPAGTPTGGQWTSAGGGVIMVKDSKGTEVPVDENSSLAKFLVKNPDGTYSLDPEREKLHDEIVQRFLSESKPVDGQAEFFMTGGGPASGKSTILLASDELPGPGSAVLVDPDAVKTQLPEFQERFQAGDLGAGSYVHEESSMIRKRLEKAAIAGNYNVLLDTTGDSSVDKLAANIEQYRSAGYSVKAYYASNSVDLAVRLAYERGQKTGRFVPETFLREAHVAVSRTFEAAVERGLFDSVQLYDTDILGTPRLVLSGDRKGYSVHDEALWQTFKDKGK